MHSKHNFSEFFSKLADASSEAIMPHFRTAFDIENKLESGFDPVTIADRNGETAIRALINEAYPSHGILGEEHGAENLDAEYVWVLDPIDGTRAFITGLPTWGTLVGLNRNGRPYMGMMAQPYVGERYVGTCDSAWYDGPIGRRTLKTRACGKLSDAVLCTTTPALFSQYERPVFDAIEKQVKLSRYGTDCYAYCMLAAGLADLVIESGLQAYDIVALVPIIEGAGGAVTTWSGGSPEKGGQIVASGDRHLHDLVLKQLTSAAD
ncbi:histidinol-phosphatase [Roseibium hamelinense]|nr:histidinol-phosphatase [Roseibium hamelinense]MTI44999.1 histidinol-phosphatase [Roseibium hamelinense]